MKKKPKWMNTLEFQSMNPDEKSAMMEGFFKYQVYKRKKLGLPVSAKDIAREQFLHPFSPEYEEYKREIEKGIGKVRVSPYDINTEDGFTEKLLDLNHAWNKVNGKA